MTDINDCWRRDIENAPKSYYAKTDYVAAGNNRSLTKLVLVYITAAFPPGSTKPVGQTAWLPEEERWQGFAKGEQPLAWMPLATHPDAT